jgi:hypothetical protein
MSRMLAPAMLALIISCGGKEATPTAGHVALRSAHFSIQSDGVDSIAVADLAARMERERQRVLSDLGSPPIDSTRIVIQSQRAFDSSWAKLIGASGIGFQVKGLNGPPDGTIYIYGPWAAGHTGAELATVALHEFAHGVTRRAAIERVKSQHGDTTAYIANLDSVGKRVRWLSETIALYEANQSTDLNRFFYLWRGDYPSIAELNDPSVSKVYAVGYRLGEFITWRYGKGALLSLVQHDGNVQDALGVSEAELMRLWFQRIENRYLLVKPRWFSRR